MVLADSVPGVSGGTIAFLLGFYDQFIGSIDDLITGSKEKKIEAIKFLIKIGVGWIIGMVLALFLLQIIESGFNILGISPYLTMALWGTLLLCFIQVRGMLGLDRVV